MLDPDKYRERRDEIKLVQIRLEAEAAEYIS
jgi:hypothetical protein